ncbi:heavy metal sensor histidine kinase [Acinetobacter vivianii]|uniref:heavy metal sensor histidine kinase n=1 Tax=Acinetobacter vivianii TaxID=1776742 RepID=UPI002DBEE97F|nr:heavy metal sensor histidine kinase [Acinetobacter vivianii]MEB6480516.1 heavy metal sensor histidine kinase [Acinetobacter vivianii]MEB6656451.1 heavy metal sensor histidine kinase [Acinetobacter vivianii]
MNRLSLASRLRIAFSLISCVVFISIGTLSYQSFREMVYIQQDKALAARIKRMEVFLTDAYTVQILGKYPKLYENMVGHEDSIFIVKEAGKDLIRINPLNIKIPSLNYSSKIQFTNNSPEQPTTRLAFQSVQHGDQHYQLIAGQQWYAANQTLKQYFWKIAFYTGLGILLSSLLGFMVGHYMFRSMRALIAETSKINVQKLNHRIQVETTNTEVQQLSHAMNEMLDKIQQDYQKLAQFSEDIAHELRTPLNNLMGQTQILLSQPRQTEELENLLYSHLEEYERLTKMIESMLFIARSEYGEHGLEKSLVNIPELIRNVTEYFDYLIEERQMSLMLQLTDEMNLKVNEALMQRAIANLISNAVVYGAEQGRITLTVQREQADCVIDIVTHDIWIEEKHLPYLFDRFYQIDESRHKRAQTGGLGLAIVQSIMQLHGGCAEVENQTAGVAFTLRLPLKN